MSRATKIIELPSGDKAEIVTYFTRGEREAIYKVAFGDSSTDPTNRQVNVSTMKGFEMQDEEVYIGVKKINDAPISRDVLMDMSEEDFDFLLEEFKKIDIVKKKLREKLEKPSSISEPLDPEQ